MKGKMKKFAALGMALTMTMAMGSTVFAEGETTTSEQYKLTVEKSVENEDGTKTANTYTAYQVMTAVKHATGTDGTYAYTYTVTSAFEEFFKDGANGYKLNADGEITDAAGTVIVSDGTTTNTNSTAAAKLASALEKYALAKVKAGKLTGTDLPETLGIGYYVVAETVSNLPVASKPILVDLRAETTVKPKDDSIELEKKIVEGSGDDETLVDANNVSIGDTITYEVTSSIPVYEANVDTTKLSYVLTDTFTNVDFDASTLVVKVGSTTLVEGKHYTLTANETKNAEDVVTGDSFVLTFIEYNAEGNQVGTISSNQGEAVTLTYSGKLTASANVDSKTGNPNKIELKYTNNPNQENSYDTLEDNVTTYTYGFKIRKVDKNDDTKDMAGATFTIKDSKGTVIGSFEYGANGEITSTKGSIVLEPVTTKDENGNDVTKYNYASIKGLDEGTYTIEETIAPKGYSLLGGTVTVVIKDNGTTLPTGKATITVSGKGALETTDEAGSFTTTDVVIENQDGTIDAIVRIENIKGISLPETGSATMLLCLAGGAIAVILGGVYFTLTRRKRYEEK